MVQQRTTNHYTYDVHVQYVYQRTPCLDASACVLPFVLRRWMLNSSQNKSTWWFSFDFSRASRRKVMRLPLADTIPVLMPSIRNSLGFLGWRSSRSAISTLLRLMLRKSVLISPPDLIRSARKMAQSSGLGVCIRTKIENSNSTCNNNDNKLYLYGAYHQKGSP